MLTSLGGEKDARKKKNALSYYHVRGSRSLRSRTSVDFGTATGPFNAWHGVHLIEKREKRENVSHHLSPDLIQSSHENHATLIHRINTCPATAVSSTNTLRSVGPQPSSLIVY